MRQSYKTIGLWVVLIIGFIALYQVFSTPTTGAPAQPGTSSTWWPCAAILLLVGGVFGFQYWRGVRNYKLNREGIELLNQGRYVQALEKFEAFAKKQPDSTAALFNIGTVQLSLWRTREAKEQFEKVWKVVEKPKGIQLGVKDTSKTFVPQHLALTCAIEGDVANANEWLRKSVDGQGNSWAILSRAILAARAADFATTVKELDHFEVRQLGGSTGALANALRSWAVERTTGELRHVDRVLLFGETGPQALEKVWPELAAFVARAPAA